MRLLLVREYVDTILPSQHLLFENHYLVILTRACIQVDLVAPGYPVLSTVSVAEGSYEWYNLYLSSRFLLELSFFLTVNTRCSLNLSLTVFLV